MNIDMGRLPRKEKDMKNKTRFYLVLAALTVAFCVLALAIPFARTEIFYVAFGFGLLALAVQLYTFPKAFFQGKSVRSKFYGFPLERLTVLYLAAQIVLSFVFMALAEHCKLWIEILVCVLLFLAALIGFVSADAMRDEIERQDAKLKTNVSAMRLFQARVVNLAINAPAESRAALDSLSEEFRYSDPVSSEAIADADNELAACLDELQQAVLDGNNERIQSLCRQTKLTLSERNRLCRLNK